MDIREKLRGIPLGSWARTAGGSGTPPTLERQVHLLESLGRLLQMQLEQDKVKLSDAQEVVARLKHGGGA